MNGMLEQEMRRHAIHTVDQYPMRCCCFHATGGHSADRHGAEAARVVYGTDDVDGFLERNADRFHPNKNGRVR